MTNITELKNDPIKIEKKNEYFRMKRSHARVHKCKVTRFVHEYLIKPSALRNLGLSRFHI